MEFLRYSKDVFGREMLVGANWDLLWLPVAGAGAVIVMHMVVRAVRGRR